MKKVYSLILTLVFSGFALAQCPTITVTPLSRTLTCNGAPATFTAISTPTTINIVGQWFGPGNSQVTKETTSPVILSTSNPGTYSVTFTNIIGGCKITQTVSVFTNSVVPSMTINALAGYTVGCSSCLMFNISFAGPGPTSFTWTNMQTSTTTAGPISNYTICNPGPGAGSYMAELQNGTGCKIAQTISIYGLSCTGIKVLENDEDFSLHPNPSNGHFVLNIANAIQNAELYVRDNLGKEILKQEVYEGNNPVNIPDIPPGIYHYLIMKGKIATGKGKLIVQ